MQKLQELQSATEKVRREKWIEEKTKKIKVCVFYSNKQFLYLLTFVIITVSCGGMICKAADRNRKVTVTDLTPAISLLCCNPFRVCTCVIIIIGKEWMSQLLLH